MYSQNSEEKIICNYFKDCPHNGTLLDIGANDGMTMSNTHQLLRQGWNGTLVEPNDECYKKLSEMYSFRPNVQTIQAAIGKQNGESILYKNGYLYGGNGLVSTLDKSGMDKWKNVTIFEPQKCLVYDYQTLIEKSKYKTFDLISIDAENFDWDILQQIDLTDVRCLVIEWNSIPDLKEKFINYCKGFSVIGENGENILFGRV